MNKKLLFLVKRLGGLGAVTAFSVLLSFLQALVLARVFGADVYGAFSVAVSVVSFLSLVCVFGLNEYLVREVSRANPRDSGARLWLNFVARRSAVLVAITSFLASLAVFWCTRFISVGGVYNALLFAVTLSVFPMTLRKLAQGVALGLKKPIASIAGENIFVPVSLIILALLIKQADVKNSYESLSVAYLVSIWGSLLLGLFLIKREISTLCFPAEYSGRSRENFRPVLVAGFHLGLIASGNMLANHMDTLMLGYLSNPTEAAFARVAWRLAEAIAIIRMIAMMHYKPLISESFGRKDRASLVRNARELSFIMNGFGIAGFLVIFTFAPYFISLFGEDFSGATSSLRAYALGTLAMMLSGPAMILLIMGGYERVCAKLFWTSLAINFILNALLVSEYGALGTGIATALSQTALATMLTVACRKNLQIETSPLYFLQRKKFK